MSNMKKTPKLKIIPSQKNFAIKFRKKQSRIVQTIGDYEINHIGSTAIPGLGGKGIIDIMIALDNWLEAETVIKNLKTLGFSHIHPKDKGRIFISKKAKTEAGDIHIHLVKKGSRAYNELLAFRNYLRKHKKEAKRYFALKLELLEKTRGNRAEYTAAKKEYLKKLTQTALKYENSFCHQKPR